MKYKEKILQFIRFGIVGVIATVTHYAIYLSLLHLGINVTLAYTIGYALSFCLNYCLTTVFTFRTTHSTFKGLGFCISHATNYLLQIVILNLFIYLGVNKELAPFPTYCITVPINFTIIRYVFTKKFNRL